MYVILDNGDVLSAYEQQTALTSIIKTVKS